MPGTSFARLKQIFITAVELPDAERAAYLDAQPDIDHSTRRRLDELLQADAYVHGDATRRAAIDDAQQARLQDWSGRQIGAYRIERTIGHGGMGTVFLAHRIDGSLEQKVAIKVVRPELLGTAALARFRLERQVLALLQHPNIPKMLDAGETAEGEPYVVMEYVDGEPIDRHVQHRRLDVSERLNRFLQICDAVAYAHRNLIVHRDLKPGNVIVDTAGRPQLLDFGIAKPLQRRFGAVEAVETGLADRFISPVYAAPEQLRGETITTSCDVYALGVLLYELLAGSPPFRPDGLAPAELERRIRDDEAQPPSRRALQHDERASGLRIDGDLDLIILRCLRKEPANRYGSVDALADDLRRYGHGLPVLARQGNVWYRASRFFRRHRTGVVATALVLAAITAGGTLVWRQQRATLAERDRADEMTGLITNALQSLDPESRTARDMSAREMFERVAVQAQADPDLSAASRSRILATIAQSVFKLGQPKSADKLLSLVDASVLDPTQRRNVLETRARVLLALTRNDEARGLIERELAATPVDDVANRAAWQVLAARTDYTQNRAKEALDRLDSLSIGSASPEVADDARSLRATVLWVLNRRDECIAQLDSLIAAQRTRLGKDAPAVYDSLRARAVFESIRGNLAEVDALGAELIAMAERTYGRNSMYYARAISLPGMAALDRGDLATSIRYEEQVLAIATDQLGPTSEAVAKSHFNLGSRHEDLGHKEQAYDHYRRAHDIAQGIWLSDDTNLLLFRTAFATFLALNEKSDELHDVVQAANRDIAAHPELADIDIALLIRVDEKLDNFRTQPSGGNRQALVDALIAAYEKCQEDPNVKAAFGKVLAKARGIGVEVAGPKKT